MINYNPKEWFAFVFHLHKADTFRKLWQIMAAIAVFSTIVAFLGLNYLELSQTPYAKNIGMMHSLLGFVISMLLVFRTNTSYDRWWEGRKLLGSLVNVSRNFAIKINALGIDGEDSAFIKKFVFFYVITLPFGLVLSLGYYMVPIIPFILYVLASLELIAEQIENPFGLDANDLPLDDICTNIKRYTAEILL
ncbi:putative membrane chloride channel (bestrophin family) [Pedobacter sp. CG_S7]|uniref:bestrophin family ion channel n=1 Tax=Pedobacter sp. CG_S7 TaxID=3143930 RepID=UPI003396F992